MNENELRKKIKEYIKITGTKQKFIAQKLNIDETLFSRWKNGKRKLKINDLLKINEYINTL